jgi:hypothetical protein
VDKYKKVMKVIGFLVEGVFWALSCLSPVAGGVLLSAALSYSIGLTSWGWICILSLSLVIGIWFAERVRKTYGSSNYWGRIYATPDICPIDEETKGKEL